jgi:hypothetical protein
MFIISINLFIINYWFVLFYIALTKDNYSLIKNLKMGRLILSNRLRLLRYYKKISKKRNRIKLCQDYLSNTLIVNLVLRAK